jgi:putative glutamine amidotransferase
MPTVSQNGFLFKRQNFIFGKKIRQMKRFLLSILFVALSVYLPAQQFFRQKVNPQKSYIVLTNPTIHNIETISYLMDKKLLKINPRKTEFVGVYFDDQHYDFTQTEDFLNTAKLKGFHLHKVEGDLHTGNLFKANNISDELKLIFENTAGVFFFGGPDIPPSVYNEENTRSVVTDPERHYFETTFLFHLLGSSRNKQFKPLMEKNPNYFVTGFCLGMQTMNVATGGTMIQDIPSEIYGTNTPEATLQTGRKNLHCNYWQKILPDTLLMGINFHPIRFAAHPFFSKRVKTDTSFAPKIYSSHHQAIEKLGQELEVTALSPDGKIIEAIAHSRYPNVFAVQFHPEVPALYEDMELRKFQPEDAPSTYHRMLGKQSVKFHKKYWKFVSKSLRSAVQSYPVSGSNR